MRAPLIACSLVALALTTACDGTTTPDDASLTPAEARALALAMDDAGTAAVDSRAKGPDLSLAPSSPSRDVVTHTSSFNVSGACALSGTAAVNGQLAITIDTNAGTVAVDLDGTSAYTACRVRGEQGVEVALTGSVDFDADRLLTRAGTASGSQTHRGTVDYVTSTGKSGSCPIDFAASFTAGAGTATRTVTGTVCGQSVDATTTWTRS